MSRFLDAVRSLVTFTHSVSLPIATISVAALVGACQPILAPTPGDDYPESALNREEILRTFIRDGDFYISPVLDAPTLATRVGLFIDVTQDSDHQAIIHIEARGVGRHGHISEWHPVTWTWQEHPLRVGYADLPNVATQAQIRIPAAEIDRLYAVTFSAIIPETRISRTPIANHGTPIVDNTGDSIGYPNTQNTNIDDNTDVPHIILADAPQNQHLDIAGVTSRSQWGARATECTSTDANKRKLSVHHTVTPSEQGGGFDAFARRIRGIQAYHMDSNGWCDIGYHFMVTADGSTWEARPANLLGAHVGGQNTGNVGVSFIGCFHTSGCNDWTPFTPPQSMLDGGGALLGKLAQRYGINVTSSTVVGHRDNPDQQTSCPGDNLYNKLSNLRSIANNGGNAPAATGTVKGVVWNLAITPDASQSSAMNARLAGATISISNGTSVRADDSGYWTFAATPGNYTITASQAGFANSSREVQVASGAEQWASIGIAPVPTSANVTIAVYDASQGEAYPIAGAAVLVSGQDPRTVNNDGKTTVSLDAGTYTVTASAENFDPTSQDITVQANTSPQFKIGLAPTVVPPMGDEDAGSSAEDAGSNNNIDTDAGTDLTDAGQEPIPEDHDGMFYISTSPMVSGGCMMGDPDGSDPMLSLGSLAGLSFYLVNRRRTRRTR